MEVKKLYVLPLIGGTAIIIAVSIWTYGFYQAKVLPTSFLSVTGTSEKIVTSDTVKWSSTFTRTVDSTSLKTGGEQMKNDQATIRAYFKSVGVKDEEITINPIVITPLCENQSNVMYDRYGNQTCGGNRNTGYSLQETAIVESDQVKPITDLSQKATDYLLSKGLVFSTQGLEYYYNKLSDLRLELISEATKNAKDRAERIAEGTGAKVGSIQSASTGVFQVNAKNSVEVSDYGVYDTTSVDKKVTAVVKVSFNLK